MKVPNSGPLALESDVLPTVLRGHVWIPFQRKHFIHFYLPCQFKEQRSWGGGGGGGGVDDNQLLEFALL